MQAACLQILQDSSLRDAFVGPRSVIAGFMLSISQSLVDPYDKCDKDTLSAMHHTLSQLVQKIEEMGTIKEDDKEDDKEE